MNSPDSASLSRKIEELAMEIRRVQTVPGLGSKALGAPLCDSQLWRLGRDWLQSHPVPDSVAPAREFDVYLASQVYPNGGHTGLIGDFVRALDPDAPRTSSRLIVTNHNGEHSDSLPKETMDRLGLPQENIAILHGSTLYDRMEQLFAKLQILSPKRLFLFHHPDDPLASIVAHPEVARQRVLIHHSDAIPSFGLHIPGVQIISLTPFAAPYIRHEGLQSELLLLTAPDPGPRPPGFLKRGKLVTASSGSAHKFASLHSYSYADTVGVILRTTGGWHVHIGPLDEAALARIAIALKREGVSEDRFVHVPWAPSVARCLWEHDCDLYFSSFPIDGARTDVEVAASATPHLRHSRRTDEELNQFELRLEGGLIWRTWEDLESTLRAAANEYVLEARSKMMRATFEKRHHPEVFRENLRRILNGEKGVADPQAEVRDHAVLHSLIKSSTTAIIAMHQMRAVVESQSVWIASLLQQNERLEQKVDRLQAMRDQWRNGKSLRERFLRWLLGL